MAFLSGLLADLVTRLVSWIATVGLEFIKKKQAQFQVEKEIDARLDSFNSAFKEAFNGQPVTSEQKEKLKQSIRDLIRGPGTNKL